MQVAEVEAISVAGQPGEAHVGESVLIRAAQEQDHDAFEQLVRLYDRSVLRVAMNLLRSEDDARDAYQEVFLRVYRSLHSFRHQCSFHTWLYRIATNVCLDHLRRKSVRKEQALEEDGDGAAGGPLHTTAADRPESDPERVFAARDVSRRLKLALEQLSPKERLVFEMKHYEGLRLRVIGEMLSISEEAAKNCLFRGTRKLRAALEEVRQ
jgi:RNA polymerase sigma-70 factor (ECF subfamily)